MKKKAVLILLTALVLTLLPGRAAKADGIKLPSGTDPSSISTEIENAVKDCPDASFETAVFNRDSIIYTGCFGDIDRENGIKADETSVYEWGSASKLLVWVSAMQLKEKGLLDLDADIKTYLPDGFLKHLSYKEPITMLHLMNHQAGFGETLYRVQTGNKDEIVPLSKILQDTEPAQLYRPGEVTAYSNWGAALAGFVIECIMKEPYSDYVRENIFKPLSMEHTAILPDHSDNEWVMEQREKSVSYALGKDSEGNIGPQPIGNRLTYINLYPAGAVTGTIGDFAAFGQALVSEKSPLFEKNETRTELLSGSFYYGDTDIPGACHGLWPDEYNYAVRTLGHNGSTDFGVSGIMIDPASGCGVVMLSNHADGSRAFGPIYTAVFGEGKKRDEGAAAGSPDNISGNYAASRVLGKGLLRFSSFSSSLKVSKTGEGSYNIGGIADMSYAGDGLYTFNQQGWIYPAGVSNGKRSVIHLSSNDLVKDPFGGFSKAVLYIYVLLGLTAVVIVVVKLIMQVMRKLKGFQGSALMTVSQLAAFGSIIASFIGVNIYRTQYGLSKAQGMTLGTIQLGLTAVYVVSLVSSLFALKEGPEEKQHKVRHIFNLAWNGFYIFAAFYLQLFVFWGC